MYEIEDEKLPNNEEFEKEMSDGKGTDTPEGIKDGEMDYE